MSIDPQTMRMNEVTLPREETRPRRLEVTSDGRVWYVDYRGGKLGVYDPGTFKIREWLCHQVKRRGPMARRSMTAVGSGLSKPA